MFVYMYDLIGVRVRMRIRTRMKEWKKERKKENDISLSRILWRFSLWTTRWKA